MANTLSIASQNSSLGTAASFFGAINGTNPLPTLTEALVQCIYRSSGTLSNLWINIKANSVNQTMTFTLRKNGVNVNQTVSIAANTTGTITDTTHTDAVVAADLVCLRFTTTGTGSINPTIISLTFAATINTVSRVGRTSSLTYSTTAFRYFCTPMGLGNTELTTSTITHNYQRKAGTFKNAFVYVGSNNDGGLSCQSDKNSNLANLSISINAGTGNFEDTTNSDAVVAGDYYNWVINGTTGGTFKINIVYFDFISTSGDGILSAADDAQTTINTSVTDYFALAGALTPSTTESDMQAKVNSIYTFSELTINVQTNGITNASTITLRANGASAGVSASIAASTTGVFSDSVNTYVSAATDLMNYQLVTASTGTSMKISHISVWTNGNPVTPMVVTGFPQNFKNLVERPGAPKIKSQNLAPTFGI